MIRYLCSRRQIRYMTSTMTCHGHKIVVAFDGAMAVETVTNVGLCIDPPPLLVSSSSRLDYLEIYLNTMIVV